MIRRRELVAATVAGTGLLTGCLPLLGLMRLGVRGSAIRGGARAARAGPRGNLYALGRTGAAALHTVRLLRLAQAAGRLARIGDIFGVENGEEAVTVDTDGQRVECSVEGVVVCSTHLQGRFFEHVSALYGPCGTSRAVAESEIHHWDNKGIFAGADVLEDRVIRHIGSKHEVLGYTQLRVTQRGSGETVAIVDRDGFLNKQMGEMEKTHREVLGPTGARDLQAIANAQAQCIARQATESCSDLQTLAQDALSRLEARFRQFT
jgi:hypothetical protein